MLWQSVVQMLSKSFSETENISLRTNCVAALQTHQCSGSPQKAHGSLGSDLGQRTRSLLTPERADCCVLGCLSGATAVQPATAPLQSNPKTPCSLLPAAPVTRSAGVSLLFVMDGCGICCPDNPLQSPFPCSPGCCFIFFQHERWSDRERECCAGQGEMMNGTCSWRVVRPWPSYGTATAFSLLLEFLLGYVGIPWSCGAVRSDCWKKWWIEKGWWRGGTLLSSLLLASLRHSWVFLQPCRCSYESNVTTFVLWWNEHNDKYYPCWNF